MGAWDSGSFGNDNALDFLGDVKSIDDLTRAFDALKSPASKYIDADIASEAVAAADLVAGMLGRPAPDMPEETAEMIAPFGEPSSDLLKAARNAMLQVLENSELADLWDEGDPAGWRETMRGLLERLDPDIPFSPGENAGQSKGGFICSICTEIIPKDTLVSVEIFQPDMPGVSRGVYFHRACIEVTFEEPYFNKSGMPEESLVEQVRIYLDKE